MGFWIGKPAEQDMFMDQPDELGPAILPALTPILKPQPAAVYSAPPDTSTLAIPDAPGNADVSDTPGTENEEPSKSEIVTPVLTRSGRSTRGKPRNV